MLDSSVVWEKESKRIEGKPSMKRDYNESIRLCSVLSLSAFLSFNSWIICRLVIFIYWKRANMAYLYDM